MKHFDAEYGFTAETSHNQKSNATQSGQSNQNEDPKNNMGLRWFALPGEHEEEMKSNNAQTMEEETKRDTRTQSNKKSLSIQPKSYYNTETTSVIAKKDEWETLILPKQRIFDLDILPSGDAGA